jgi:hypothetical protein
VRHFYGSLLDCSHQHRITQHFMIKHSC